jgi:stage II sporulation protein D
MINMKIVKIVWRFRFALLVCMTVVLTYSCVRIIRKQPPCAHKLLSGPSLQPAGPLIRVLMQKLSGEKKLSFRCDPGNISLKGTVASFDTRRFEALEVSSVQFRKGRITLDFCDADDFLDSAETAGRVVLAPADSHAQIMVYALSIPNNPIHLFTLPGTLELIPGPESAALVNEVDFEEYVLGVVGQESIHTFTKEAYRAQSIASRTYALYHWRQKNGSKCRKWHITATTAHQKYGSPSAANRNMREAVAETCGYILTFHGTVFQAYFSSTCGGNTTEVNDFYNEPEIPPFSGNGCPFCATEAPPKNVSWRLSYSRDTVQRKLREYFQSRNITIGTATDIEPALKKGDIYPVQCTVQHSLGRNTLPSLRLKSLFQLKSQALVECRVWTDEVLFIGKGFGHGFGMCQYGSNGMAKNGSDFLKILYHYYPESELTSAWTKEDVVGK